MRRLKLTITCVIEVFLVVLLFVVLFKKENSNNATSASISLPPEPSKQEATSPPSNRTDYVTHYKLVDFDRKTLDGKTLSFLKNQSSTGFKFILFYTRCKHGCWGSGRNRIVDNCFFTSSRKLFKVHEYDALLFNVGEEWKSEKMWRVPSVRSPHQKYVMYTHECVLILEFSESNYNKDCFQSSTATAIPQLRAIPRFFQHDVELSA
jgi:hypothetical protein